MKILFPDLISKMKFAVIFALIVLVAVAHAEVCDDAKAAAKEVFFMSSKMWMTYVSFLRCHKTFFPTSNLQSDWYISA